MSEQPSNLQIDFVCEADDIIIYQVTIGRYLIGFIKKHKAGYLEGLFKYCPFYTLTYRPFRFESMTAAAIEMVAHMKGMNDALTQRLNMVQYK